MFSNCMTVHGFLYFVNLFISFGSLSSNVYVCVCLQFHLIDLTCEYVGTLHAIHLVFLLTKRKIYSENRKIYSQILVKLRLLCSRKILEALFVCVCVFAIRFGLPFGCVSARFKTDTSSVCIRTLVRWQRIRNRAKTL